MVVLYPRPYRPARLEIYWRTWRDLHPLPMSGYEMLPVARLPWWRGRIHLGRSLFAFNVPFGVGELTLYWRRH